MFCKFLILAAIATALIRLRALSVTVAVLSLPLKAMLVLAIWNRFVASVATAPKLTAQH